MHTRQNRIAARRNVRRKYQLAPLAAWQRRQYLASQVTLLDGDFDPDPVLPPTAADHHALHMWLRRTRPTNL